MFPQKLKISYEKLVMMASLRKRDWKEAMFFSLNIASFVIISVKLLLTCFSCVPSQLMCSFIFKLLLVGLVCLLYLIYLCLARSKILFFSSKALSLWRILRFLSRPSGLFDFFATSLSSMMR